MKCGFSELNWKDEETTNGGMNWGHWTAAVLEGVGACAIGLVCPEAGAAILVDASGRAISACFEN